MADEVLDDSPCIVVLAVCLEECGTEYDGQIVEVHLVYVWKALDTAEG